MATYTTEQATIDYAAALRSMPSRSPLQSGTPLTVQPQFPTTKLTFRQRVAILIAGADAPNVLFGPQQPLQPTGQSPEQAVIGRPWDFPVGFNTRVSPRSDAPVSFATLKALANGYDVLRGLIERVKDKVVSKPWSIQPTEKGAKRDARCDQVQAFFQFPDRENSWQDWARMVLDQVLVLDAPALYLRNDRAGRLYSVEVIDGAMIQPKIMADGRLPPPEMGPAYQQVIKSGLPAVDYIRPVPIGQPVPIGPDGWPMPELLYKPRNKRVDSPYGYGPVEQMITTVNIALAREAYLMQYYTEGSTPDLLLTTPSTWTTNDIAQFQVWWDALLVGNLAQRRGAKFVPDGVKAIDVKAAALTDETDQWLIRVMCFFLGLNPMPFIKSMNKGQEKTHHDEAQSEGLEPWQMWFADLVGFIIRVKFGYPDLKLHWEEDEALDPLEAAQVDEILVNTKIYHPDEIRAKRGDDPMSDEMRAQMDVATFNAAPNSTILPDDQQAAKDDAAKELAASKPAPVMAAKPTPEESAAQKAHEIEVAKSGAPVVTVAAPHVEVAPAAVHVDGPTIHLPEMKAADVFVDVGATTVKVDAPRSNAPAKVVKAERMPDGTFRGTISEQGERTITQARDADGNTITKVSP
jgi:hypothetical protein